MKRILLIVFALFLSLTITGCTLQGLLGNKKQKSQSSSQNQQKPVIAVALNEKDPNKALILRGIEDMAQKEKMDIKVIAPGTTGGQSSSSSSDSQSAQGGGSGGSKSQGGQEGKTSGSGSQETSSPLKGAKILIYQGGNPELLPSVQENKIPVIALNAIPSGVKPAGIILPDPQKVGQLMAEPVLNKVTEGQVLVLQGDGSDSVAQETLAAVKQTLAKNTKLSVQTLASPAGSETIARQGLLDFLQKNPGKVQAIIALNEGLAAQAADVLKSQQLEKKVLLVGGQANLQSLQRMASGTQAADIDTSPYIQGINSFQWAQKIVNNEPLDISESVTGDQGEVPAKIVPVKPVTPENLAVVQKSYAKAAETAAKAAAPNAKSQSSASGSSKNEKGSDKQGQGQSGSSGQGQSQGGGTSPSGNIPQGATKVTEKVQTTITREYMDDQGKVLGTEKSTSEQNRTIPPDMLKKEIQQQTQPSKGQQGQQGQEGAKGDKS